MIKTNKTFRRVLWAFVGSIVVGMMAIYWNGSLLSGERRLKPLATMGDLQDGYIGVLVYSASGRYCASGGERLIVRDLAAGKTRYLRAMNNEQGSAAEDCERPATDDDGMLTISLDFSPDSRFLASGDQLGLVRVWEVESGRLAAELDGHHGRRVQSVAFSPDGSVLASAGDDRVIMLWDAKTWEIRKRLSEPNLNPFFLVGLPRPSSFLIGFRPDGQTLVSAEFHGNTVLALWDTQSGERRVVRQDLTFVLPYQYSPDRRFLLAGGRDDVSLRSTETGSRQVTLKPIKEGAWSGAGSDFSRDGRYLAVPWFRREADKRGFRLPSFDRFAASTYRARITRGIAVHEVSTGRAIAHLDGEAIAAFSPSGETLATTDGQGRVRLWSVVELLK
jgi:WD40 repeat protein